MWVTGQNKVVHTTFPLGFGDKKDLLQRSVFNWKNQIRDIVLQQKRGNEFFHSLSLLYERKVGLTCCKCNAV